MKCVIIAASPDFDPVILKKIDLELNDIVICADGGYSYAKAVGITVDYLISDFDSLEKNEFCSGDTKLIELSSEKDETDTLAAVKLGLELGYAEFIIYASLGGRLDHTIANINTLNFILDKGARGRLVGRDAALEIIKENRTFENMRGKSLSLFSFHPHIPVVTLKGFKYPLNRYELSMSDSVGISNIIACDTATIIIERGRLLVIENF